MYTDGRHTLIRYLKCPAKTDIDTYRESVTVLVFGKKVTILFALAPFLRRGFKAKISRSIFR
jgi:hypothetical protein